jgi:hypothetical protein
VCIRIQVPKLVLPMRGAGCLLHKGKQNRLLVLCVRKVRDRGKPRACCSSGDGRVWGMGGVCVPREGVSLHVFQCKTDIMDVVLRGSGAQQAGHSGGTLRVGSPLPERP